MPWPERKPSRARVHLRTPGERVAATLTRGGRMQPINPNARVASVRRKPKDAACSWNERSIRQMEVWWAEGHTAAEIGRRLGVGESAVVGKVAPTSARPSPDAPVPDRTECHLVTVATITPPSASRNYRQCCWPPGEPHRPDPRFCGAHAAPGRPYCAEHVEVACARRDILQNDAA